MAATSNNRFTWDVPVGGTFIVKPLKGQTLAKAQSNVLAAARNVRPRRYTTRQLPNGTVEVRRLPDDDKGSVSASSLSIARKTYQRLRAIQLGIEAEMGFRPNLSDTINHVLKKAGY